MSNRFSPLHNDDQNVTTKWPTNTIPNIPEKIPGNSRNTSPHVTNTLWKKRKTVCTTENYPKTSYLLLKNNKAILLSFSGANTKQLNHYILPPLVDDKPDAVNIDVECRYSSYKAMWRIHKLIIIAYEKKCLLLEILLFEYLESF